ncbi:hypothetical protein ACFRFJ_08685 [Streptomyces hydrogenans]|uniref:hypothetical protein n=1 Tax=Streptomyces hydrogenans TaxID=1873719 RepID=UPI0036A03E67
MGAQKGVAEGVPSSSDPRPANATATAHSWCSCGRDLKAFGRHKVARLADDHTRHRTTCPLLSQGKDAA